MRSHIPKFQQIKKIILFIWDYRCYVCKFQAKDNDVHHINENPYDNGSHNLIPLCKQCHKLVHKNISLDDIVYPDDVAYQLWKLDQIWTKFGSFCIDFIIIKLMCMWYNCGLVVL